jgi:NAD(P)-dependent dehydrogenase (short-subunit alcohol dehydrogenase family)
MEGKTVVITGATSGIGEVTVGRLASMGARIVFVARDRSRGEATLSKIRQAAEQAVLARRSLIDSAIADFAEAIGDVIDAIKEASASLTATCSTLKGTADTTLARMASASSASAETTHRMDATVTATEELSGSIQEIGEQATRGLGMAQSAVGDTRRTQDTIRSLAEAAERIGSVSAPFRRLPDRPISWRSTPRSRRRAPGKPARVSPWSPRR